MKRNMKAELDAALAGVRLSKERRAAILAAAEGERGAKREPGRGRPLRTVLIAAAICAALTVTVFALSPTLRDALRSALGSFAPYSQDVEGVSVTDQGLRFKVLSAISDGNAATVYFEVQDLEGDRLDREVWIGTGEIDRPGARYAAASYCSPTCLGYDADTSTALFSFRFTGDGEPAKGGTLHLEFDSVLPDADRFSESPFPHVALSGEELPSKTLPSGEVVLVPGKTLTELENTDELMLSSVGFASDGKLHIQYKINLKNVNRDETWVNVFIDSKAESNSLYRVHERADRYNVSGPGTLDVYFEQDGILYLDSRTGVTPADIDDIALRKVYGAIVTKQKIMGEWTLDVPLQDVEHRTIPLDVTIGKVTAESIDFTILGATAQSDPNGSGGTIGYPLAVFLADGSKVLAGSADSAFHAGGYAANHWTFPEPVDTAKIIGFSLGKWYMPLEGGSAGPGYWLSELPE